MGGTSASGNWRRIALPQADVALWPHWLDTGEADALFAELLHAVAWENHRIRLFGRELDSLAEVAGKKMRKNGRSAGGLIARARRSVASISV